MSAVAAETRLTPEPLARNAFHRRAIEEVPAGFEQNWIPTAPGKNWFAYFAERHCCGIACRSAGSPWSGSHSPPA
jgi:hypothetical protein